MRTAYGRLVSYLSARTRDLAAAEDALSEGLVQALRAWPRDGVPRDPVAWLATAARRRSTDDHRRHERERRLCDQFANVRQPTAGDSPPDERVSLLLACAHPTTPEDVHGPLMLQATLGLPVDRIAAAYLVAPGTLARRLSRAKAKLREAAVPFEIPDVERLPERLQPVLDAVHTAFTLGWEGCGEPDSVALVQESIWLTRSVVERLPDEPEPRGLLALLLHSNARRGARRGNDGGFVPLGQQDCRLWDHEQIDEAEGHLRHAASLRRPGPLQTMAAIQSVHADRRRTGRTDWQAVLELYDHAVQTTPTVGVVVGRAAALVALGREPDAVAALESLPTERVSTHQPYWVIRSAALAPVDPADAYRARQRAIGLTTDPAVRSFLAQYTGSGD